MYVLNYIIKMIKLGKYSIIYSFTSFCLAFFDNTKLVGRRRMI